MAKGSHKVLKKKRVKELLNKLLEDANILNIYTKEIEKCSIINISVTLTIQGELKELREKSYYLVALTNIQILNSLTLGSIIKL